MDSEVIEIVDDPQKLEVEKEKSVEGDDLPDKVPETQDLIQQNPAASSSQSAGKVVQDGEPSHNLNVETLMWRRKQLLEAQATLADDPLNVHWQRFEKDLACEYAKIAEQALINPDLEASQLPPKTLQTMQRKIGTSLKVGRARPIPQSPPGRDHCDGNMLPVTAHFHPMIQSGSMIPLSYILFCLSHELVISPSPPESTKNRRKKR
ncbi:hypothetical protein RIF29_14681 [Crotalaria pallida]|uniref:Uncharacterized protein n=1 Tax=Crotalaria pallida TaxID=3830 RepID=A0AAN9ICY5_CROPI